MSFPKNLRLCRLCLLHKDSFVNIHEPNDRYGFVVVDEINELLQLNVTPGDGLPEGICYECLNDLSHFKRFKKVSHEAEITLRYILNHDVESGISREKPGDMNCTNSYAHQEVDPLMLSNESHAISPRRSMETNCLEGEDVEDDADVALMCEATLSEAEETLTTEGQTEITRRAIKEDRAGHSSEQRIEISNVYSLPKDQMRTRKIVRNGATNRKNSIPVDVKTINSLNIYKCSECLTVFQDECTFRSHISSGECAQLYMCSVCNETFVSNACLMEHNVNYHGGEVLECDSGDPNMALTMKRGFVCDVCGSCFRKKILFEYHMLKFHAQVPSFKCKICWKSFLTKGGLKEHLVVHSTERPFVCEICGSAFKLRKKLLRHVRNCHSEK